MVSLCWWYFYSRWWKYRCFSFYLQNFIDSRIHFIYELECDSKLPFLECFLSKDGLILFTFVSRKDFSGFIPPRSNYNHPWQLKFSLPWMILIRTENIILIFSYHRYVLWFYFSWIRNWFIEIFIFNSELQTFSYSYFLLHPWTNFLK